MDNNELKNEFLIESFENLSSINSDLTALEKNPTDKDLLNKIYRTVHTMKGSASFLAFKKLQEITHAAENLLDELREDNFQTTSVIIDTLLETFDICQEILKSIEVQNDEGNADIEQNKSKLNLLLENQGTLEAVAPASNEEDSIADEVEAAFEPEPSSAQMTQPAVRDDELSSLISAHKSETTVSEASSADINPTAVTTETPEAAEDDMAGLSSAALESLKELIDEGKVDSSSLGEVTNAKAAPTPAPNPASAPSSIVETKVEPKPEVEVETKPVEAPVAATKPEKKVEAEKPAMPAKSSTGASKSIADSFVRVNVETLDKIMNVVGELVLNRNQIVQYSNMTNDQEFSKLSQQLNTITSELQSRVMSTRMQPIGSILTKFERIVRDLSRQNNKKISLKLTGQETELDKTLIEAIKDPLVHIIRNSCDHGIETLEEREKTTKSIEGMIHIKSYNESGQVTVEIVDDGRGLNREKIGAKAIEKGVVTPEKLESMSDEQIYSLIFAPGFSTAEKVTNISGRGVGMDVVKTNIEKIGGSVSVQSELGVGTTFKLRIPLTLAIVPALIIKANEEAFAIPQLNLVELVRLETAEEKANLEQIQGNDFLRLRGKLTPVFTLKDQLALSDVHDRGVAMNSLLDDDMKSSKKGAENIQTDDGAINLVILNAENHCYGIVVDEILDTEEIVVKPLNNYLKQLNLFGGATIMGDGRVAFILDAMGFLNKVTNLNQANVANHLQSDIDHSGYIADGEVQENLLFRLNDGRKYALPLSLVSRLEEFDASQVEKTGNQPIVRYLNQPMPLINIEHTLVLDGKSPLTLAEEDKTVKLPCIVTTLRGRNYGLIVDEILDISIDRVEIDDVAVDREGILGTIFIDDSSVSLLDLYTIIDVQNMGRSRRQKHEQEKNDKVTPIKTGKRILLVDDSPMYRKLESDALLEMGFEVVTAKHGEEALDMLRGESFDLIVTDIEMPKLNGFDFARKVRTELNDKETPIIALSTRFSEKDKAKGVDSGFTYHLEKFRKEDVLSTINLALKQGA